MSYYGPSFAGIESGWYSRTRKSSSYYAGRKYMDSIWSEGCTDILKTYVLKYGTYFTAFCDIIMKDIDVHIPTHSGH